GDVDDPAKALWHEVRKCGPRDGERTAEVQSDDPGEGCLIGLECGGDRAEDAGAVHDDVEVREVCGRFGDGTRDAFGVSDVYRAGGRTEVSGPFCGGEIKGDDLDAVCDEPAHD